MNRLERLYERRSFGIRPGLERERAILEQLGNPQDAYATIHVAGTNGKGSVCTILESILLSAGLRVGLYTSPHLVRFNERIHVGGRPVDDKELAEVLEIVDEKEKEATFFECATAIGFETFRRNNVQIAIIEAGMGGRLDATNVVKPVVTAITCISLEHTEYLGPDIASIATEKAGIIKEGCPLVTGVLGEEAQMVVDKIAAEKGVVHVRASEAVSVAVLASGWAGQKVNVSTEIAEYGTMSFPLAGEHQTQNLAVAIGVVELLRSVAGYEIDETHVREGVAGASWPGRCQTLSVDPLVIVDGAHNSGGGRALAGALRKLSKGKSVGMIIGMCDDKDVYSFLREFSGIISKVWAVPLKSERNMSASVIKNACRMMGLPVSCTSQPDALLESRAWAKETDGVVCVTGSLFLAGQILEGLDEDVFCE